MGSDRGEPVLTDQQRDDVAYYDDVLRQVYGGRQWIVTAEVMVGASGVAHSVLDRGATGAMLLAVSEGTGEWDRSLPHAWLPDLAGPSTDMLEGIRAYDRALGDPGAEVEAAMDAFDPEGTAQLLAGFISSVPAVGTREVFGARRASWIELEDKLTVDALWDAVGVDRCASRNVALADPEALAAARAELDAGEGTVWVGDNSQGWHGGGVHARIVANDEDANAARVELADVAREVRIMPFLEGIPCSIHGIVFDDTTIAFRPCEMVVFRDRSTRRFVYAQAATTWDPAPGTREEMRDVARRVGEHLREIVDFRGAFTVDGVVTTEGFRPTELNSRFGGALAKLAKAARLPMIALHTAAIAGAEVDWQPERLERLVVGVADANRSAGGGTVVAGSATDTEAAHLAWDGTSFSRTTEDDPDAVGTVSIGPTASGRFLIVEFRPGVVPEGRSSAPYVSRVFALTDEIWGTGIGELECPTDVQRA